MFCLPWLDMSPRIFTVYYIVFRIIIVRHFPAKGRLQEKQNLSSSVKTQHRQYQIKCNRTEFRFRFCLLRPTIQSNWDWCSNKLNRNITVQNDMKTELHNCRDHYCVHTSVGRTSANRHMYHFNPTRHHAIPASSNWRATSGFFHFTSSPSTSWSSFTARMSGW